MATWPGVSLSLYWSRFCAVMVNSGCSLAKGLARKPLESTVPAFCGSPPVHSGMLPSALPAFSAPMGVSVVPSLAASSGDTAASAAAENKARDRAPDRRRVFDDFIASCSW
ncbi:hypothetical protein D9M68_716950 [compost metagenome]